MGRRRRRWQGSPAFVAALAVAVASGCQPLAQSIAPPTDGPTPITERTAAPTTSPTGGPVASIPATGVLRTSEEAWGSIATKRLPIAVEAKRYYVFSGG